MEDFKVHETAIVDTGAEIGAGSSIGTGRTFAVAQKLEAMCPWTKRFVGNRVHIGDNCKVQIM